MNILRLSRNITIIAFLLSLLFHASTVFYLFMQKKTNSFNNSIEQQQEELEKIQKKDEWVETKSRASNFGAPVFFKDESSFAKASSSAEATADTTADKPTETQEDTVVEESSFAKATTDTTADAPEQQIQKNDIQLHNEVVQPKPISIIKKRAPRTKKTQTKTTPQQNPFAAPQQNTQKPPLSLAQLTQGFLNHIKDEGKYSVSMLGKKTGLPSAQQMQYERYLQKLEWCVENSFRINRNRSPLLSIAKDVIVHVLLELHQDGTIKQLGIAKTSGNTQLDKYTLFIFQDASSSFPPVPQSLSPFSIICMVPFVTTY